MTGTGSRYRSYSLWLDTLPEELAPRPRLQGDLDADVAIVGAGYTGLWTAYYLLKDDPTLRVVLLEKEITGFGASGRNGGWCSALFAAPLSKIARRYGRPAALAQQHAMFDTVDEVGRVLEEERIDAAFHKGGTLTLVTSPTQLERVRGMLADDRRWGFDEEHYRWIDAAQLEEKIRIPGSLGARFTPHCARLDPARLVRGLARKVEELGGVIYEQTPVTQIGPRTATTATGTVRAGVVVRATEGYTATLKGMR
ncbi:MAG: FAD-binding oxidoreductase, partial [Actinomycetota bacterium]|nr:FAD-binding oxidoreductase [Actinomycetota bacterium]